MNTVAFGVADTPGQQRRGYHGGDAGGTRRGGRVAATGLLSPRVGAVPTAQKGQCVTNPNARANAMSSRYETKGTQRSSQ